MDQSAEDVLRLLSEIVRPEVLERISGGAAPQPAGRTFGDLADEWLRTEAARYVEPGNEQRHVRHMAKLLGLREAELTPKRVREVFAGLLVGGGGHLGPNTVNKIQATARRIIQWAQIEEQWGPNNPFAVVRRQREVKPEHARIDLADCRAFLPFLRPDRRRMALCCLYLGLRSGEAVALRKEDLDLTKGAITIRRSRSRDKTKTGAARVVPIPTRLRPVLVEALEASDTKWVFPATNDQKQRDDTKLARVLQHAFRQAGLVTGWKHACNRKGCGFSEVVTSSELRMCPRDGRRLLCTGLPRAVGWRDLRHAAATLHKEAGCDPHVIALTMGHSMPGTTENIYTHVSLNHMRTELDRLAIL